MLDGMNKCTISYTVISFPLPLISLLPSPHLLLLLCPTFNPLSQVCNDLSDSGAGLFLPVIPLPFSGGNSTGHLQPLAADVLFPHQGRVIPQSH